MKYISLILGAILMATLMPTAAGATPDSSFMEGQRPMLKGDRTLMAREMAAPGGDTRLDCWMARSKRRRMFDRASRDVYVSMEVRGKHCIGHTGHHWVEPVSFTVRGDFTGNPINCTSWQNFWQGIKWRIVLFDGNGRYYSRGPIVTDCDEDTYIMWTFTLRHSPILLLCDHLPQWKGIVTLMLWRTEDPRVTMQAPLWDYTGPARQRCL